MRTQSDYRSRKFLSGKLLPSGIQGCIETFANGPELFAERNFYLHGSCLLLSLILSRTYSLVLDLIKAQEELAIFKAEKGSTEHAKAAPTSDKDSINRLDKPKVKPETVKKEERGSQKTEKKDE